MKTQKPIKLDSKMTLVPASMDEVRAFSSKNYRKMFGTEAAEQLTLRLNRKKTQAQEKVRAAFRLVPGLAYFFVYNGKKSDGFMVNSTTLKLSICATLGYLSHTVGKAIFQKW